MFLKPLRSFPASKLPVRKFWWLWWPNADLRMDEVRQGLTGPGEMAVLWLRNGVLSLDRKVLGTLAKLYFYKARRFSSRLMSVRARETIWPGAFWSQEEAEAWARGQGFKLEV